MRQQQKAEKISKLKTRLELYYKREEEMLSGGVQSYGIGTRNATRYGNTRSPSEISSPASFKLWIFRGRRKLEEKGAEKFQGQQLLPSMGYRPQQ